MAFNRSRLLDRYNAGELDRIQRQWGKFHHATRSAKKLCNMPGGCPGPGMQKKTGQLAMCPWYAARPISIIILDFASHQKTG
jgi:hypothetical protein